MRSFTTIALSVSIGIVGFFLGMLMAMRRGWTDPLLFFTTASVVGLLLAVAMGLLLAWPMRRVGRGELRAWTTIAGTTGLGSLILFFVFVIH